MPFQYPAPTTAWQASLQPASFRGVPFGVDGARGAIGRRGKLHEYPFRDIPWAEDLGRRARRYVIDAFLLGDDAVAQAQALVAACEQKGSGTLVHPTLGVLTVQVDPETPIEWELRTEAGRLVQVRFTCVEAGQVLYPGTASDTQAATNTAADNAVSAAQGDMSNQMTGNAPNAAGSGSSTPTASDVLAASDAQLAAHDADIQNAGLAYQNIPQMQPSAGLDF